MERKTTPYFWNLNEDPQLSNMVAHLAKPGQSNSGFSGFVRGNRTCGNNTRTMHPYMQAPPTDW